MGAGIFLPLASVAFARSKEIIISDTIQPPESPSAPSAIWTPPQYSKPALTILTVPAQGNPVLVSAPMVSETGTVSAPVYQGGTPPVDYVFDAVFKLTHQRTIRKTQHPVLTGATISDHFYVEPARLVLEIGMSDAMSAFVAGIWVGASTKSISAWQILKNLEINGTLLTVTTRLDTYSNMQILSVVSPDDNKTKSALRATITLEELLSASVSSVASVSARPQTSDTTSSGIVQSVAPNSSQVQQNVIPSTLWPDVQTYPKVPGASNVSSNSLGQSVSN